MPSDRSCTWRALATALAVGATTVAGGCGDDAPVRAARPEVRVTLDEYAIAPQGVSVTAGRIELIARNAGRLTHNLRIETEPEEPDEQGEQLGGTPTAQPGETVRATIELQPGRYRMRCSLANHDDLGEWGELIVRPRGR